MDVRQGASQTSCLCVTCICSHESLVHLHSSCAKAAAAVVTHARCSMPAYDAVQPPSSSCTLNCGLRLASEGLTPALLDAWAVLTSRGLLGSLGGNLECIGVKVAASHRMLASGTIACVTTAAGVRLASEASTSTGLGGWAGLTSRGLLGSLGSISCLGRGFLCSTTGPCLQLLHGSSSQLNIKPGLQQCHF